MSRPLTLGFITDTKHSFNVDTPYHHPLGGSESALCYLAVELARLGHQVSIFGRQDRSFTLHRVAHHPSGLPSFQKNHHDFLIFVNIPAKAVKLKPLLSPKTQLILWAHHQTDQPATKILANKNYQSLFDAYIFVSHWQQETYSRDYKINRGKIHILRNAVSPAFARLFNETGSILAHKTTPPTLAYTTIPNRGLDTLIDIFPQIRQEITDIKLKIFSSMRVYQDSQTEDELMYGDLYHRCRHTPGVSYHGSVSQTQLAQELKSVLCLVYPNSTPETSCISALEAMAAGCQVITSESSALPETTAGFALLLPATDDLTLRKQFFTQAVIDFIQNIKTTKKQALDSHLRHQVDFVNLCNLWPQRAKQWEQLLYSLI